MKIIKHKYLKLITAFLLIFIGLNLHAQIKWDEKRPLTWKDFSSVVDDTSPHFANTNTSTNYKYKIDAHNYIYTLTFEVECFFLLNGSWCKPGKQTTTLLHHEQLHFDMQELFARKLLAAFKANTFTGSYTAEIKTIYYRVAQQSNVLQRKYDLETNYGEIKKGQLRWEKFMREQLKQTPRS